MGLPGAGLTASHSPLWMMLPQFLRWHVPSWKVPVMLPMPGSEERLGAWAQMAQPQHYVHGPVGEEPLGKNQPFPTHQGQDEPRI